MGMNILSGMASFSRNRVIKLDVDVCSTQYKFYVRTVAWKCVGKGGTGIPEEVICVLS